ncbi:MAG TPA: type VI secretion system tube protein Hcp [Thermoleophilaceae bacterium]|nr:type VI secretion system tube protein Hcp [Thermoleophilaceae bacterium]
MHHFRPFLPGVATVAVVFGLVAPAHAANDYFLEVEGMAGESQNQQFAHTIDVSSYSWGASRDNKPQLQNFQVSKNLDLASPALFRALAQGTTVPSAELIGVRTGSETSQVFVRYCLQNVRVASIQQSGQGEDPQPSENVSFSYGAFSEQYSTQKADGTIDQTVFAGWNLNTGLLIQTYPGNCGGPL